MNDRTLFVTFASLLVIAGCDNVKLKSQYQEKLTGQQVVQTEPATKQVVVVEKLADDGTKRQRVKRQAPEVVEEEPIEVVEDDSEFAFDESEFAFDAGSGSRPRFVQKGPRHPGLEYEEAGKILLQLVKDAADYGPTLAVWLVDRTPSAKSMVEEVTQHVAAPYGSLAALNESDGSDARLLTAVCTFGASVDLALPPTGDPRKLGELLGNLPTDTSGKEVPFQAIQTSLEKYLPYRTKQRREVIFIVVTDEAGDDAAQVDSVIATPKRYGIPIYVLGVPAPFGRRAAVSPAGEPGGIRQGPESLHGERLQLGFWGDLQELQVMDSGFGPFALEKLCRASGGRFLALRPKTSDFSFGSDNDWPWGVSYTFSPEVMRPYLPRYGTEQEYQAEIDGNAALQALGQAARMSQLELLEFPQREFVKSSEAELARQLATAQQVSARLEPAVNQLYEVLIKGESARDDISVRRLQVGFDLAMGRAMAAKARVDGYNVMLAALKRGRNFEHDTSTTWILRPAATIDANSKLKRMVDEATKYLERIVSEHPNTPWAVVAARELETPIGWEWTER